MDSNPIHHPSLAKKMKCSFLGYVQLLMISRAVRWTQTPSATPLQPKKWNAHFCITFNFWWSAGLVDGLEPYPPPVSSQKMKCSYFDYVQLLMICQASQWTQTPSATTTLDPKKWNPHFCITFNFWCWPDWSMDSNPIHHPSPANKMKCFFLDYVHFWWSSRLVDGLEPHPPVSSQKNEMLIFVLHSTSDVGQTGHWTRTPFTTPLQQKKMKCFFFGLCSTSDDWPGWVMDSNPIHHPSPAKKMKCSILDYIQLFMIGRAGQWTQTPSTTRLQPKKMKSSFLYYVALLMISQAGRWTRTSSATSLQPIKWNAHFWVMFNFWWLVGLFDELKPHLPPLSSQ